MIVAQEECASSFLRPNFADTRRIVAYEVVERNAVD